MLMANPIHPSGLPKVLRTSFGHFLIALSTLCAYFCTNFSTLTAHFEEEFSTPHPSFQTILGPCTKRPSEVICYGSSEHDLPPACLSFIGITAHAYL